MNDALACARIRDSTEIARPAINSRIRPSTSLQGVVTTREIDPELSRQYAHADTAHLGESVDKVAGLCEHLMREGLTSHRGDTR